MMSVLGIYIYIYHLSLLYSSINNHLYIVDIIYIPKDLIILIYFSTMAGLR